MFYLKRQSESAFLLLFIVCLHVKREQCLNFYVRFWSSHIFNRWTPLNRRGGRSPMSCFLWMVLCECAGKKCVCVHLPLLLNLELHHASLFVCWCEETRIESSALPEITVLHTHAGNDKENTKPTYVKKQTDNDTNTVRHSDKWHTWK